MASADPIGGRSSTRRRPGRRPEVATLADLVDRIAALVRGGCTPDRAWVLVTSQPQFAQDHRSLRSVAETAMVGGDVAAALDRVGSQQTDPSQAGALRSMALAWRVGTASGAPLVPVLTGLAAALREDLQVDADRRVALAGPRATATVLTWLPIAGLAVSVGLGAVSVPVVVSTPAGLGCLLAGATALALGRWWTGRMLRAARHA